VCSDIALLGDLVVNRTVERDFLFLLSIYPRIFLTLGISFCVKYSVMYVYVC